MGDEQLGDELHYCAAGGYLVPTANWLPSTSFDYHWLPSGPFIGCSHLVCERCQQRVRTAANAKDTGGLEWKPLYDALATTPPATISVDPAAAGRLYACWCASEIVTVPTGAFEMLNPITEERRPWACAGHPVLTLPASIDGVSLDAATDWVGLARSVFLKRPAKEVPTLEALPSAWIERLYWVQGKATRDEISTAVAALVDDSDPVVRAYAVTFFWRAPFARGAERVIAVATQAPEQFVGVPYPNAAHAIWDYVADIAAVRNTLDESGAVRDPEARELLRQRALVAPGVADALYGMARNDQDWLLAHDEAVVRAAGRSWSIALYALRPGPDARVGELAADVVARGQATRDEVLAELRLNHSDGTVRAFEARISAS